MNHYAAWKNILIVFFLFISGLYALPNLYGSDLAIQISGTDEFTLQQKDSSKIEEALSVNKIEFKSVELKDDDVLIRFNDSKSQLTSKTILKDLLGRNYVVALNLAPSIPQWLSSLGGKAMSLGLDLRGGVHFLLEVDMNAVNLMSIDRFYSQLRATLREEKLYKKILKDNNYLIVSFRSEQQKNDAKKVIKNELPELVI